MGIVRLIVTLVVGIPMIGLTYIGVRQMSDWLGRKPIVSAEVRYNEASRKCMIAEAAEGTASPNDQTMIIEAMIRMSKKRNVDPCWLFTRYTLMRAPSQEEKRAALRDPDVVLYKGDWFAAAGSRIASATKVVDKMLKGDRTLEPGESPEIELKRRKVQDCVERYVRIWPFNTSRTDPVAMRSEMAEESFTSPSGTVFFCPKTSAS